MTRSHEKYLRQRAIHEALGFRVRFNQIDCEQCQIVSVNGVFCHETGCPNIVKPCRECGNPDKDGTCCQPVDDDFVGER